jgi:hypothetical protein
MGADAITHIDTLQVGAGKRHCSSGQPVRTTSDHKLAERGFQLNVDFERTAAAMSLARNAGVPVAQTLAVDGSYRTGPWQ